LKSGESIQLIGFGTFSVADRAAREVSWSHIVGQFDS